MGVLNYEVSFSDCDNVIVRYMRFRQSVNNRKQEKKCCLAIKGKHVIFDHCSIQWGRWDCIGMTGATDVTMQYCMIGEGVDTDRDGISDAWETEHGLNPNDAADGKRIGNEGYSMLETNLNDLVRPREPAAPERDRR